MEKINWDVFQLEEKIYLKRLIKLGQYKRLTNIDMVMNPDKEYEIQKMINALEPIAVDYESKVKDEYKKKHPEGPQNPTEEAELEEKLRIEFESYKEKMNKKRAKRLVKKVKIEKEPVEEPVEESIEESIKVKKSNKKIKKSNK